jgi:hypothetical protein
MSILRLEFVGVISTMLLFLCIGSLAIILGVLKMMRAGETSAGCSSGELIVTRLLYATLLSPIPIGVIAAFVSYEPQLILYGISYSITEYGWILIIIVFFPIIPLLGLDVISYRRWYFVDRFSRFVRDASFQESIAFNQQENQRVWGEKEKLLKEIGWFKYYCMPVIIALGVGVLFAIVSSLVVLAYYGWLAIWDWGMDWGMLWEKFL